MSSPVLVEQANGVATVTLNRPGVLNAIDAELLEALVAPLEEISPGEARTVVLAGNAHAFCSGADQGEMVPRGAAEWEHIVERYLDPIRLISEIDAPVVARLHGDAVGGGLGLAMACDFRIAAEGAARLCAPFVRIGLAGCDMSAGYFLPRLVGLGRATEIMMTGRFVDAPEAERIGLVTRCVPATELDTAVEELARGLADGPPRALAFTKRAIRRSLDRNMEAEFDYEVFAQVQCLQSADHREGIDAYQARRTPRFEGR